MSIKNAKEIALFQAYPNPFKDEVHFLYNFAQDCEINLSIYSLSGKLIKVLSSGRKSQGTEEKIVWNGKNAEEEQMPNGFYLAVLTAGRDKQMKKIILLR